jgi:hypothetical protein
MEMSAPLEYLEVSRESALLLKDLRLFELSTATCL